MKFIQTLLAFLMIQVSIGQWNYNEGGNSFDGKYKVASVKGIGTDYPYVAPILVVNKFDTGSENFYIGDSGYWQEDSGISIRFYFDESETVYSVYDWGYSSDNKQLFFREFNNPLIKGEKLSKYEIMDLLRKYSKVTFRIENDYGRNTLVFYLKGSSAAINKVYPDLDLSISLEKKARLAEKVKAANASKVRDQLIEKLKKEKVTSSSIERIQRELDQRMGLGIWSGINDVVYIKDIIIRPKSYKKEFDGDLDVFLVYEDDTEVEIYGTFIVERGAPIYARLEQIKLEEAAKIESEIAALGEIFQKFKIPRLIKAVKDQVKKKSELSYPKWEIGDVKEIKATIDRPFRDKIMGLKLILMVQGVGPVKITMIVADLDIKLNELTEAGLEPLIEF